MKYPFILLVAFLLCTAGTFAQEEPIPPRRTQMAKVGAVGGFTTSFLFMDLAPINDFLNGAKMGRPFDNGPVFMDGGAGAVYIIVVKNLRVGGIGMGGSRTVSVVDAATAIRRDATIKAGYGAVTIEYVVPLMQHLDLIGGAQLGAGGIDLIVRKSNGASMTWGGEQGSLGGDNLTAVGSVSRTLSGKFFVWIPTVSLEYSFLGWAGVRVGASYLGMSSPTWKVDDNYDLLNVPSTVSGKGWTVNVALLLGTF
jgi:hypothetical protein